MFDLLNNEFNFSLDVCADRNNKKCKKYFDTNKDGLKQEWSGVCWMNPPYGRTMKHWIEKAYREHLAKGITVVALIPADITDTTYFWHFIYGKAKIRYIKGRLKFKGYDNNGNYITNKSAPFPSMIVIWQK